MQKAIIRLLEKTNNIPRSIYIWNAINAIVLAMQTPVVAISCSISAVLSGSDMAVRNGNHGTTSPCHTCS